MVGLLRHTHENIKESRPAGAQTHIRGQTGDLKTPIRVVVANNYVLAAVGESP
jgi:hypothetical protein